MIYAFAHIRVSNPDSLAAYREKAGDALARHGGKVEAAAKDPTILEGDLPEANVAAILSFADRDGALAWINDPDLQDVHALRRGAGKSTIYLLG